MPEGSASNPQLRETSLLRQRLGWFTLLGCAVILYLRRPDAFTNPQFWAEDGYFFTDDRVRGFDAIISQYNGYLHFVPRLIAAISGFLDPAWAPAAYVCLSALCTLYVAALTLCRRFPIRPAAACAFAVVLIPDLPDVLLNPTNLQSILAGGFLALFMLGEPETEIEWWHDLVALILLSLTGPFSVILTPFFLVRACLRRSSTSILHAAIVLIGGAIQLYMIIHYPLPPHPDEIDPPCWSFILAVPGSRVFASLFFRRYDLPAEHLLLLSVFGLITIVGLSWLAWGRQENRRERIFLLLSFFALLASAIVRIKAHLVDLSRIGYGSRYFYAPQLIAVWLLLDAQADRGKLRWVFRTLLAWILVINAPRLREPEQEDKHWENYARRLREGKETSIPINPDGWTMKVPAWKRH